MKEKLNQSQLARLNKFLRSPVFAGLSDDDKRSIGKVKKSSQGRYQVFWQALENGYIAPRSEMERQVVAEARGQAEVSRVAKEAVRDVDAPSKKVLYSFHIDPEHLEALKAIAAAEDRTVSGLMRMAIAGYLRHLDVI